MNLGAPELIIIALIVFVMFGYKKLPDASRSFGRSLRIFKGELKGLKEDDLGHRDPTDRSVPLLAGPTAAAGVAGGGPNAEPGEQLHHGEMA